MEQVIKETANYIEILNDDPNLRYRPQVRRERKFMCVGGRFSGQRRAQLQLHGEHYIGFNYAAGGAYRMVRTRGKNPYSQIWVDAALLP